MITYPKLVKKKKKNIKCILDQRERWLMHCEYGIKVMYSLFCVRLKLWYGVKTYLLLIGFLKVCEWLEIN